MMKRLHFLVRIAALVLGLSILAILWFSVTIVGWGLFSGQLLGAPSRGTGPSIVVIACAVLSYIYVAARVFGARLPMK